MSDIKLAVDEGTTIGGRYFVVKELGSGGLGLVVEARAQAGEHVAVKLIPGTYEGRDRERVLREIDATAELDSPHVVPVIDHGFDDALGMPFMVMPLIEGTTLSAVLRDQAPLDPVAVVKLARQIASGLQATHARGVVHRDVKPSNVLLERLDDGHMRARLSDFGLSRGDASVPVTAPGASLGTPLYMAPEQALDARNVDARADLWSLGATLYHALTGHPPFHKVQTRKAWLDAVMTSEVAALVETESSWVPAPVALIVHRLLARQPSGRYADAGELLTALSTVDDAGSDLLESELVTVDQACGRTMTSPAGDHGNVKLPSSFPTSAGSHDVDVGTIIDDRYTLVRQLGHGGMGAVYEASTEEGTSVAVKVIKPDVALHSTEARRRFLREARTAMAIESEHVVRVEAAGTETETGMPYIVMEMLTGFDLGRVVEKCGPLEPDVATTVVMQACRGLAAAHRHGMVHRDIKPGNIFLHELADGRIQVKLCDFGIVKQDTSLKEHASTGLTQTGGLLGSPLYMSPEQAQNAKQADVRSDVWSMCAALYEALTGKPPWTGCTTIGEVLLRLYTRDVPPVQDEAPWVDIDLARLVHKGLTRDPEGRHATADELTAALAPFAREELLTADVLGVSDKRRSERAPRLSLSHASGVSVASTDDTPTRRGRSTTVFVLVVAAASVAVAVLTAFAVASMREQRVPPPPPAHSSPEVASSTAPPPLHRVSASVRIEPSTAVVRVDGSPVSIDGGWISVEALPGSRVEVEAEHDHLVARESVVITAAGEAIPSVIVIDAGAAPPSAPSPQPRRGVHEPKSEPPAASVAPPPPTAPTAKGSAGPTFHKEW